jgi:hypothetical protein
LECFGHQIRHPSRPKDIDTSGLLQLRDLGRITVFGTADHEVHEAKVAPILKSASL